MPKVQAGEKYRKRYTEESVLSALEAIEKGMSQREAGKTFGVPRQTLQFRQSDKFKKTSLGPNPVLTNGEESILEEWTLTSYEKGFPVRKLDIQASVKEFLDSKPRENPFKDNLPGDGWYNAFLKRHPALTHRTAESVTAASSTVGEGDIRKWFASVEDYLKAKGFDNILQDPSRVFNGDETCFYLCPKNTKVLAPKGAKNVYEIDSAQAKVNITVMFTFSASGEVTDPMIIYPYKRLPAAIINSVRCCSSTWGIGHSDNGWMTAPVFYEYIGNVFHPYLEKAGVKFPVILFVDGHSTHQTLKLSQLCTKLQIILIALYPNATRIMQPADVAAFKPLKTGWKRAVLEYKRKNPRQPLTKERFAPVLKSVIDQCTKADTIKNGFRASGLQPWNPSAIDFTKCLGRNKSTVEPCRTAEDNLSISYNKFKEIVGDERIKLFDQIHEDTENTDEFILLYKIYQEFKVQDSNLDKTPNSVPDKISSDLPHTSTNNKENNLEEDFDIQNIDIIFADEIVQDTNFENSSNNLVMEVDTAILQELEQETTTNLEEIILSDEEGNKNEDELNMNDAEKELLSENVNNRNAIDLNMNSIGNQLLTIYKNEKSNENEYHVYNNDSEEKQILTEQNAANNNEDLLNASLRDYILWPKTPERKGKKQSERLPFVLTCSDWKKNQEEKLEAKKEEEKEKNNRKVERDLKKVQKEKDKLEKQTASKKRKASNNEILKRKNNKNMVMKTKYATKKQEIVANEDLQKADEKNNITLKEKNVSFEASTSKNKINIISCVSIKPNLQHVRKLFVDEDDNQLEQTWNVPFKNALITNKMCFICASKIQITMKGIKCNSCNRTFHIKCILNKSPVTDGVFDFYYCKTCTLKKTNNS